MFRFDNVDIYMKYPELIPFVGEKYTLAKKRILLVGESHYTHKNAITSLDGMADIGTEESKNDICDWYNGTLLRRLPDTNSLISNKGSYYTCGVVNNYLNGSSDSSYHIFSYPAKVISQNKTVSDLDLNERETFKYMAFMNYFQRPALEYGKSIKLYDIDKEKANENFREVIDILQPDIIIFVSKPAYRCFLEYCKKNRFDPPIQTCRIPHPCSPWWNRKDAKGSNGKAKLNEFLLNL